MLDKPEIIAKCHDSDRNIIGGFASATEVIRLTTELVVKVGNVREEEAASQRAAYKLLDPQIVLIPRVHCFFEHDGRGYLVMEYIDGQRRSQIEDRDSILRIARLLKHLHKLQSPCPGPPGGGVTSGILWSDDREITFRSATDIEHFWNRRLFNSIKKLDFQKESLVFCHLDLAPRNLVWLEDGRLCLLDWANAGYYPLACEYSALAINVHDYANDCNFTELLMEAMDHINEAQREQVHLILLAQYNNLRFHFRIEGCVEAPIRRRHDQFLIRTPASVLEESNPSLSAVTLSKQLPPTPDFNDVSP